jgi:hypothetical protein
VSAGVMAVVSMTVPVDLALAVDVVVAESGGSGVGVAVAEPRTVTVDVLVDPATEVAVVPGTMPVNAGVPVSCDMATGRDVDVAITCPFRSGTRTAKRARPHSSKAASVDHRHHRPDGPPMANPR